MFKKTMSILLIVFGICTFPFGGFIMVGIGIYMIRRSKKKEQEAAARERIVIDPIKTFSFEAAGFRFNCRFPNNYLRSRQSVLARSRIGDLATLRIFEWEGTPAIAIISQKNGADLGVVPAKHVETVLELCNEFCVVGKIISMNNITYRDEEYYVCGIELSCYKKDQDLQEIGF